MDLVSDCKLKLKKFRVKELRDVLSHLGLVKQGRKQELLDRILGLLSGEEELALRGSTNELIIGKERTLDVINDVYSKLQGEGACDSTTDKEKGYVDNIAPKEEILNSITKICCPCGNSLATKSMVKCANSSCGLLQHKNCVIIPEKSSDGIPPAPSLFYCEVCRVNQGDPFWVNVKNLLGPVKVVSSEIPVDGINTPQTLNKEFEVTRSDLRLLENSEFDVQVWCILLNDIVQFRMQWPQYGDLKVNGIPVKTVSRSGEQLLGTNGRDNGAIVSLYILDGLNKISLSSCDSRSFCLGVRLAKRRNIQQVLSLIPKEQESEPLVNAVARVCRCIGGGMATTLEDGDSDLEVIADSVPVNLRCPISGSRMKTASRFKSCVHMGCFDLETYIELNQKSRKWQCPICLKNYSWEDIIIDPYFSQITKMIELSGADITEIDVDSKGFWRAKNDHAVMDLNHWHSPDGATVSQDIRTVCSGTQLRENTENPSNIMTVSSSAERHRNNKVTGSAKMCQDTQTFGSGAQVRENAQNSHENVITVSSSSESDRNDQAVINNLRTAQLYNVFEKISISYNLGATSGTTNISSTASFGDPNIVILSDSEEESDNLANSRSVRRKFK